MVQGTDIPASQRLQFGRLLIRALDKAGGPVADRWREERGSLWQLAREALPWAVHRPVEMPYLAGLDVGARIVYEGPAPFAHILEYIEAAGQGYSYDDPQGWYLAKENANPNATLQRYRAEVREFCRRWDLGGLWAQRLIVYAHVHAVHAGNGAAEAALDAVAAIPEDHQLHEAAREAARTILERG